MVECDLQLGDKMVTLNYLVQMALQMDHWGSFTPMTMELYNPTYTLPETNKSPLKLGRNPKGKDRLPTFHSSGAKTFVSGSVTGIFP